MKNYFDFNLTGKKLIPIWILFLVLFFAPYLAIVFQMKSIQPGDTSALYIFPIYILLIIIAFVITFYIAKLSIENVSYVKKTIVFNGKIGKYLGIVLLGFFLSIVTFGIYMAWFIRDMHRFFVNNSTFDSNVLNFQGKGNKLFLILLLTIIIPIVLLIILMVKFAIDINQSYMYTFIYQAVMMIIMIPYLYFVYKWMVDINYKDYNISWKTNFWNSFVKIAVEFIFGIITFGIYMPLGILRLYKYFVDKTVAVSNKKELNFGYDIDQLNDFLFVWGQLLLTIITLGIYFPWAFCNIGKRILNKTYLKEN